MSKDTLLLLLFPCLLFVPITSGLHACSCNTRRGARQSHQSALVRPAPPVRPFWPATAGGCVLLYVHISPVLPCPGDRVLIQLDSQKAALTLFAMHLLHLPKVNLL